MRLACVHVVPRAIDRRLPCQHSHRRERPEKARREAPKLNTIRPQTHKKRLAWKANCAPSCPRQTMCDEAAHQLDATPITDVDTCSVSAKLTKKQGVTTAGAKSGAMLDGAG
jgi:hypothetical protein